MREEELYLTQWKVLISFHHCNKTIQFCLLPVENLSQNEIQYCFALIMIIINLTSYLSTFGNEVHSQAASSTSPWNSCVSASYY